MRQGQHNGNQSARTGVHELWSSRMAFLLAAVGGAVGFANFWRFPFLAGQNGGSAFVLVYIGWVLVLGIPAIAAELILGRRGHLSPVASMRRLIQDEKCSRAWMTIGWLSIIGPFLALTYYSVIASWSLDYLALALAGAFEGWTADASTSAYRELLDSPMRLLLWHSLFMAGTVFIVARGVRLGLELANKIMMPSLFLILLFLAGFAAIRGDFAAGVSFLFKPDFSQLTLTGVFLALGQVFFSLSVGGGFLMTYSAYLPQNVSLPWASISIGAIDTLVALFAGLAIFPIVFAFGIEPNSGPGLMFETMPVAFGAIQGGAWIGGLFFLSLFFAAITSSISMLESPVCFLEEHPRLTRHRAALGLGAIAWFLGIAFILSFNEWKDFRPLHFIPLFSEKNLFGIMDQIVASLVLPLNGLLIALFAGWVLPVQVTRQELRLPRGWLYRLWLLSVRCIAPVAILLVLISAF